MGVLCLVVKYNALTLSVFKFLGLDCNCCQMNFRNKLRNNTSAEGKIAHFIQQIIQFIQN